jgi:hypothetical protein
MRKGSHGGKAEYPRATFAWREPSIQIREKKLTGTYLIRDSGDQLRGGKIWGNTRLKYVAKPNPESEQVAREIALDYLLGRIGQIPVIFNGWVYIVDYDGKYIVTVTAKDETTVHFTYRFSSCRILRTA